MFRFCLFIHYFHWIIKASLFCSSPFHISRGYIHLSSKRHSLMTVNFYLLQSAAPVLNFHPAVLTLTKNANINTGRARGMSIIQLFPIIGHYPWIRSTQRTDLCLIIETLSYYNQSFLTEVAVDQSCRNTKCKQNIRLHKSVFLRWTAPTPWDCHLNALQQRCC